VGICLGPYGGPKGGAVSYERGTPVTYKFETLNHKTEMLNAERIARRSRKRSTTLGCVDNFRFKLQFQKAATQTLNHKTETPNPKP